MKVTDFLDAASILPHLQGKDKRTVLEEMARLLVSHHRFIDADSLLKVLIETEKRKSTGIGEGIAIPHGRVRSVGRVFAAFARSREGVDFGSLDGERTYLFFLLVAPEDSEDYLKALARIARLLKDESIRARLMEGETSDEIFNAIEEEDAKL